MSRIVGEFDLIERCFAPLAKAAEGAFGLKNDAALLEVAPGRRLVVTVDGMVAGQHFLPDDPAESVGRKLLRVSLSDLAAMGAKPLGYLLSASWPPETEEAWIAAFCEGLAADQRRFDVTLIGGDTTATPGPMTLSLTAFGEVAGGRVLDRGSLRPGDDLYLSGGLGEAWLGLRVLRGEVDGLPDPARDRLVERYRCPLPRVSLGQALLAEGLASAALDVSDGLAQDLGHLLTASGVGADIQLESLPVSASARAALDLLGEAPEALLSGGDDYELLFASAPGRGPEIASLADRLSLPLTRIGQVRAARGLTVQDAKGEPVDLQTLGWTHF